MNRTVEVSWLSQAEVFENFRDGKEDRFGQSTWNRVVFIQY